MEIGMKEKISMNHAGRLTMRIVSRMIQKKEIKEKDIFFLSFEKGFCIIDYHDNLWKSMKIPARSNALSEDHAVYEALTY